MLTCRSLRDSYVRCAIMAHQSTATLSVLTPVLPERSRYLPEAAASVDVVRKVASALGWQLDWVVVIDGPGDVWSLEVDAHTIRLPARAGVAAARNIGLSIASGDFVLPLDADDVLDPDGVAKVLAGLSQDEGWVATNRVLLDGTRTPHWNDRPRSWPLGQLASAWSAPFPFHPNSVIAGRELALGIGGWPALGANEDLAFALKLSEASEGRVDTAVSIRYRVWEPQEVHTETYLEQKALSFGFIEASINAARRGRGAAAVQAPKPGPAFGRIVR